MRRAPQRGDRRRTVWIMPAVGTLAFPHNPKHKPTVVDGKVRFP
jgi:hypothetical protein